MRKTALQKALRSWQSIKRFLVWTAEAIFTFRRWILIMCGGKRLSMLAMRVAMQKLKSWQRSQSVTLFARTVIG